MAVEIIVNRRPDQRGARLAHPLGEGVESFNFPTHVFRSVVAGVGTLFVTDTLNFRISAFDERGTALGVFGRHGDGTGGLAMPKGGAADRDGVLYEGAFGLRRSGEDAPMTADTVAWIASMTKAITTEERKTPSSIPASGETS